MRRTGKPAEALVVLILFICAVPTYAVLTPPDIAGTSTATLQSGGTYDGWYLYVMSIEWNFEGQGSGLSHWDVVLYAGCAELDHLIEFDSPAGYSTTVDDPTNPMAMGWSGYFERDGDTSSGITDPVLKYNNPFFPLDAQPGEQGYGTFSFYANIIPEYGTYEDALVAKAGLLDPIYGDLEGAYPSCTIIPEPSALLLLAFGGLALIKRKRA
ncbi:MAG: PEP-CTERM sorting domain-containing protein [Planctomycetota bacterium]|jgi:hypothetical protein